MPKRFIVIAVSLIAVLVSILFGVSVAAQQECPSPRLIDEITGSGDQQSPPFDTTTDLFRVSYQTTADNPEAPFFLHVESPDPIENIAPQATVSRTGSASGETFANSPPGRYYLVILTTGGTSYTIRVEECGEGGQATPGEGTSGQGATKAKASPPVQPPPPPPAQPKAAPVQPKATPQPVPVAPPFNAGGPKKGPVPRIPGGGCPSEYPEVRGGGCYR